VKIISATDPNQEKEPILGSVPTNHGKNDYVDLLLIGGSFFCLDLHEFWRPKMPKRHCLLDTPAECYTYTDAGKILNITRTQVETIVKEGGLHPVKTWSRARPRIPRWQLLERLGLPFDSESYDRLAESRMEG
jgi:hypothetical protein